MPHFAIQEPIMAVQIDSIYKFLTKWIVPAAAVIAVLAALFGGIRYIVNAEVADMRSDITKLQSDVGTLTGNITTLHTDIGDTNKRIDDLLKDALERAFPKTTTSKEGVTSSLKRAEGIIRLARSQGVKLDSRLIESYGKQVAALREVADPVAPARQTLKSLLDYRSFLNADAQPQLPNPILESDAQNPKFHLRFGNLNSTEPKITAYGLVPSDQAAVVNFIGEHLNLERPMGAAFVLLEGDEVILDGLEMKNVVLRNVSIRYYGSRVLMENVYFVNCTFTFPPQSEMSPKLKALLKERNIEVEQPLQFRLHVNRELLLADKILESPSVTFTVS